jgi:hypothetical protein
MKASLDLKQHDEPLYVARIDQLTLRPKNERDHSERNLRDIARSLTEYGQQAAVLITPDGEVVKGNGTVMAARDKIGWQTIVVKLTDLEGDKVDEFAIADNQTGQTSEWDVRVLSLRLKAFKATDDEYDFGRLGFEDFEVEPLLVASWDPGDEGDGDGTQFGPQKNIRLDQEQHEVVMLAIERAKRIGATGSHGEVLVVICQHYLDAHTENPHDGDGAKG